MEADWVPSNGIAHKEGEKRETPGQRGQSSPFSGPQRGLGLPGRAIPSVSIWTSRCSARWGPEEEVQRYNGTAKGSVWKKALFEPGAAQDGQRLCNGIGVRNLQGRSAATVSTEEDLNITVSVTQRCLDGAPRVPDLRRNHSLERHLLSGGTAWRR